MRFCSNAGAIILLAALSAGAYSEQSLPESTSEPTATEDKQANFEDLKDRFSYAYGYDLAEKFKTEGLELNVALMAEAMDAVFRGGEKKMSSGEVAATLEVFQRIHAERKEAEQAVVAEKNQKEGEEFLTENAKRDGVVVTESGLQYKVITEGTGNYTPTEEDEVIVHYRGMFVDGTEFDSTHQRNEPYQVKVKQLIPGWTEALTMMSEGSKWELYIPAHIAYGEKGAGEYVGPNATLIFEVELLDISKANS
ncbi:FKBP-type peptidyl-prolyl cis-trans isomerase [Marinobacter sp.]|uniref:FKBP-type peptidyl-prolyl cis-trans isomerase n=1 Tax=Marinobacter sp. TaxID=50741 RepID=UPI0035677D99